MQGRSLVPLIRGRQSNWRKSFLVEYFNEAAWPWIVGMSYKAVRTDGHKLIHWIHKEGMDELYDLERDPYELHNVIRDRRYAAARKRLTNELRKLVTHAIGL